MAADLSQRKGALAVCLVHNLQSDCRMAIDSARATLGKLLDRCPSLIWQPEVWTAVLLNGRSSIEHQTAMNMNSYNLAEKVMSPWRLVLTTAYQRFYSYRNTKSRLTTGNLWPMQSWRDVGTRKSFWFSCCIVLHIWSCLQITSQLKQSMSQKITPATWNSSSYLCLPTEVILPKATPIWKVLRLPWLTYQMSSGDPYESILVVNASISSILELIWILGKRSFQRWGFALITIDRLSLKLFRVDSLLHHAYFVTANCKSKFLWKSPETILEQGSRISKSFFGWGKGLCV